MTAFKQSTSRVRSLLRTLHLTALLWHKCTSGFVAHPSAHLSSWAAAVCHLPLVWSVWNRYSDPGGEQQTTHSLTVESLPFPWPLLGAVVLFEIHTYICFEQSDVPFIQSFKKESQSHECACTLTPSSDWAMQYIQDFLFHRKQIIFITTW